LLLSEYTTASLLYQLNMGPAWQVRPGVTPGLETRKLAAGFPDEAGLLFRGWGKICRPAEGGTPDKASVEQLLELSILMLKHTLRHTHSESDAASNDLNVSEIPGSNDIDVALQNVLQKRPTDAARLTLLETVFDTWNSSRLGILLQPGWAPKLQDILQDFMLENDMEDVVCVDHKDTRFSGIYHMLPEKVNTYECFVNGSGCYLCSDSSYWFLTSIKPTGAQDSQDGGRWKKKDNEVLKKIKSEVFLFPTSIIEKPSAIFEFFPFSISEPSAILIPIIKKTRAGKGDDVTLSAGEIISALQEAVKTDNAESALARDLCVLGLGECTLNVDGLYGFLAENCEKELGLHQKFTDLVIHQLRFVISLFEDGLVEEALYFLGKVTKPNEYMITDARAKFPVFNGSSKFYEVLLDTHSALQFESHLAKGALARGENQSRREANREEQLTSQTEQLVAFVAYSIVNNPTSKCPPLIALEVLCTGTEKKEDGWNRTKKALLPMLLGDDGEFSNNNWLLDQVGRRFDQWFHARSCQRPPATYKILTRCQQAYQVVMYDAPSLVLRALKSLFWALDLVIALSYFFFYAVIMYELQHAIQLAPGSLYRFFFAPLRPRGWYKRSVANGAYISRLMSLDWTDDYTERNKLVENTIPQGGFLPVHSKLLLRRKFFVLAECWAITSLHYADFFTDILVIVQWYGKGYTGAVTVGVISLVLPVLAISFMQLKKAIGKLKLRSKMKKKIIEMQMKIMELEGEDSPNVPPLPDDLSGPDNGRATFRAIFIEFLASATNLQMLLETVGQLRLEANDESRSSGEDTGGANDLQKFKLIEAVLESFPSSTMQLFIIVWEFRNKEEIKTDWINLLSLVVSLGSIAYAVGDQRCRTVGTSHPILFPLMFCQHFVQFALRSGVIVLFVLEFEGTMYIIWPVIGILGERQTSCALNSF
jgi:hypothetical protein